MSLATFTILVTIVAYVSIPAFIVLGIVWLTNREHIVRPEGLISLKLRRVRTPIPFAIIVMAFMYIANLPIGLVELINGSVVDVRHSKYGFTLKLLVDDGDITYIESSRPWAEQMQFECRRQRAFILPRYVYTCKVRSLK